MKKLSDKFETKFHIVVEALMILLLTAMLCVGLFSGLESNRVKLNTGEHLDSGWFYAKTNVKITDKSLTVKSGESLVIKRRLPENIGTNTCIGYYDPGFKAIAYISATEIYSCGDGYYLKAGKEQGTAWRKIELDPSYEGKEIIIAFENNSSWNLTLDFEKVLLGSGSDIGAEVLENSFGSLIVSILCLIIAIGLFAFSFGLRKLKYSVYEKKIMHLAHLNLCVGVWVLFYGSYTQTIIENPSVKYMVSYISLILIPVFILGYYKGSESNEDDIAYKLVLNCYELVMSACLILYLTGAVHISKMIFFTHIFMVLEILMLGFSSAKNYLAEKTREALMQLISFSMIIVITSGGLIVYYIGNQDSLNIYVGAGYIAYMIVLLTTQVSEIVAKYRMDLKDREFKKIASVDGVTGGNSRMVAYELLQKDEIYAKGNPWVLHMDLINFSSVNASLGWEKGNDLLREIYQLCESKLYDGDFLCSLGNSDFVFILNPSAEIDSFCSFIKDKLTKHLKEKWNGIVLKVKFSAVRIQKGESLESMLDHAIMAYTSSYATFNKESNCYYYNSECADAIKRQFSLETRIEDAIEKKEFKIFLQPKVDPLNDKLEGAEALIRWESPTEGLISPGDFIPAAEKSGQVRTLDLLAFRMVCEYLADREKRGLEPIKISVNVSKADIAKKDFFDPYVQIMKETNVPAWNLEFELTESTAFEYIESVTKIIEIIHSFGSSVSMDDFGSSYSNLGAISRLKLDVVKLDKLFFDNGFPDNEKDFTLVKGVIEMFHNMGIKVVCEGVEAKEQAMALRILQADLIQGYVYSKPLPIDKFEAYKPSQN